MPNKIQEHRVLTLTKTRKVKSEDAQGRVNYKWESEAAVYDVHCEIDVHEIMHKLASKAVNSKRGRSVAMNGRIRVKISKRG